MDSLFVSLISIALIVVATVSMTMSLFTSSVNVTESWEKMEQRSELLRRTSIEVTPVASYNGGIVRFSVANKGQTNLSNFEQWDIIAEYQGGTSNYIDYQPGAGLTSNEWTVEGIYLSSNISLPEAFDYHIINGGETATFAVYIDPEPGIGESVRFTISTDTGVTAQCIVTRTS